MTRALLITGDRHADPALWQEWVGVNIYGFNPAILIHGGARGIDAIAGGIAHSIDPHMAVEVFPAEWGKHGRSAGPKRNQQMLNRLMELRDAGFVVGVHAFHNDLDASKGTKHMVAIARKAGVKVVHCKSDHTWEVLEP